MKVKSNTGLMINEWVRQNSTMNTFKKADPFDSVSIDKLKIQKDSFLGQIVGGFSEIHTCDGFFTLLCGSGDSSIIEINEVNSNGMPEIFQGALIIAYDKCGSIFAINAGADKNSENGSIIYLPVDSLTWEALEIRYSEFLLWVFTTSISELEAGCWKSGQHINSTGKIRDYILGKAATYYMFHRQKV